MEVMQDNFIKIKGARVHNLKNINLNIPRNKLVVITGISGSGKSSLAFDTLYAEGQRRYVESLSAYARQFLGIMNKPEADKIEGISPAISIDQRKGGHNPRSTVGTITEIYDYLRLLYSRIGQPYCPKCQKPIISQTIDQITDKVLSLFKKKPIIILASVINKKKGEHKGILEEIKRSGFSKVRINNIIYSLEEEIYLEKNKKHNIEVIIDRLIIDQDLDKPRLIDSLELGLKIGKGNIYVNDFLFSDKFSCKKCGISFLEIEPRLFSFNNPYGACSGCTGLGEKLEVDPELVIPNKNLTLAEGAVIPWMRASHKIGRQGYFWYLLSKMSKKYNFSLDVPVGELDSKFINIVLNGDKEIEGVIPNLMRRYHETDSDWTRKEIEQYMIVKQCPLCKGKRLKPEALAVKVADCSIDKIVDLSIIKAIKFFKTIKLSSSELKIAKPILKEIIERMDFLQQVGLDYLTLSRKATTLSGGEEQRIRLATQIGSKLTGVLYILDEPSIGLHSRDQQKLINILKKLRDLDNTVIVVEHDRQTIEQADWVIDIGPGAGRQGGRVVFQGTPKQLLKSQTLTGDYLAYRKKIQIKKEFFKKNEFLLIKGAKQNNLKNIDVSIPLSRFVCVTGISGSGKSSLVNDILAKYLLKKFYKAKELPGSFKEIKGTEYLNKVVLVDQSPIGRTSRSNPATYTGIFSVIRDLFSKTREARIRGYTAGRFSFNVKGGRCENCEGQGEIKVEMYFLPDIYTECQECKGKRYNKPTLEVEYNGKNIAEILSMTIQEALMFFKNIPSIYEKLKTLEQVGLSYLELGQPAPSLSGGEAQRIKLASELSKKATGKTLYILDEPTTGLHFEDIRKLLQVLRNLVKKENTVLSIEHNLDFIKNTDWIIDLGPEGGDKGGYIIDQGEFIKKGATAKLLTKRT
ncbi:MAG: excinuclease ABC subunit UvrA [Candidatus Pacebacteria bacterium]|nr:excinuclease ABC subunit UvrA [Candidatus Paceibacterota bacterium]